MNFRYFLRLMLVTSALSAVVACAPEQNQHMVGTLERDRIELKTETNEPISAIAVEDGQLVRKGDVVLVQDERRFQARSDQQQAVIAQAQARLSELQRGPRAEAIREAQARLKLTETLRDDANNDFERSRKLFERQLSSQADLDHSRAQWEAAMARAQADREALSSLVAGTTVEELQQAQAAVDAAEARGRELALDLQRLTLRAPADGRIDRVLYETGERPQAGATVAIVLDQSSIYARIYVPEPLRGRITTGTALEVLVDGETQTRTGTVRWVSADASFTPYFALTEHDRSRLSFLAEVALADAPQLVTGLPLEAWLPGQGGD